VVVVVAVAAAHDPDPGLDGLEPGGVAAVPAPVVVHLVHVDLADERRDAGLDVCVVAGLLAAEITAQFRAEFIERDEGDEAQVVLVGRAHPVPVKRDERDRHRMLAPGVQREALTLRCGLAVRRDACDVLGVDAGVVRGAAVERVLLERELAEDDGRTPNVVAVVVAGDVVVDLCDAQLLEMGLSQSFTFPSSKSTVSPPGLMRSVLMPWPTSMKCSWSFPFAWPNAHAARNATVTVSARRFMTDPPSSCWPWRPES
jgi:hypothetical protein